MLHLKCPILDLLEWKIIIYKKNNKIIISKQGFTIIFKFGFFIFRIITFILKKGFFLAEHHTSDLKFSKVYGYIYGCNLILLLLLLSLLM